MDFTYKTLERLGKVGQFDRKISPLVSSEDLSNRVMVSGGKAVFSKGYSRNEISYPVDSVMMYQGEPQSSRQRMRPWLEARINSGEIQGLEWIDQSQLIFKVPWKHVGNREWKEDDSQIFKEWAVHTGRFTEGVDQPDWPTWKTRFRCALHKLPDIKELKEQNQLDGNVTEPYRVYQFVQRPISSQDLSCQLIYDREHAANQEPVLPTTVADEISTERLASDLDRIHTDDLIQCYSSEIRSAANEMDTTSGGFDNVQSMEIISSVPNIADIANKPIPGEQVPLEINPCSDSKIHLSLKYRIQTVLEKLVTNPHGCRIFHGSHEQFIHDFQQTEFPENCFGSQFADPVMLPVCEITNPKQKTLTQDLLNAADRGILFKMEQGNIVALRKCKCTVFVSSQSLNNGETTKLIRDEPTVIFDFHNYFYPALEKYLYEKGSKPSYEVIIGFGQRFQPDRESVSNLLISATLTHAYACQLLTQVTCNSPASPPIELSKSDDYDKFLHQLKLASQQNHQELFLQ